MWCFRYTLAGNGHDAEPGMDKVRESLQLGIGAEPTLNHSINGSE